MKRPAATWPLTTPFAIASSLWLLILPLTGLTENTSLSITDWPLFLRAAGSFFSPSSIASALILGFIPACLWQLSINKPNRLTNIRTVLLWISLAIIYMVLGLINTKEPILSLITPQFGIMLGIIVAFALRKSTALEGFLTHLSQPNVASKAIIIVSTITIVSTMFLKAFSSWETLSLNEYISTMPDFLYMSYKQLMLWIPIGMIFAFSPKQVQTGYWILAGLCSYLLVTSLPFFPRASLNYLEISFASLGCLAGLWMGTNFNKNSNVECK